MARTSKAEREKLRMIRDDFKKAIDADRLNRREAIEDMKFIHEPGAQWDEYTRRERGERPSYEFNKLRVTVKRVVNDIRINRPQGKVRAVEDSDRETADIYEGLIRNIWNTSDGDTVVDQAAEYVVGAGLGAWRLVTEYSSDTAWDQDIRIEPIRNPFCLYADPSAEDPLRRDARYWFLTTRLPKEVFEEKYGKKAEKSNFEGGEEFEDDDEWVDEDSVRVVEYWYKEPVQREIVLLEDGTTAYADEVPEDDQRRVLKARTVQTWKIRNCIASGAAILEEGEWAGSQFPFVMIHGDSLVLDGRNIWFGLVRFSKDAQRAYNYSRTYAIEAVALSPQAKFWATPTQAQGHTEKWAEAHQKNYPWMLYNPDPEAGGPPVDRQNMVIPPSIVSEIQLSSEDIKGVTGIYDASLGARSNETSGIAIRSRQAQGEIAVFNFADNVGKGIRRTWELLVDLIPNVYDTARSLRILGPDGVESYVQVNHPDPFGGVVNDITKGKFDVTVTVGPSFATQRQEAAEAYMGLANSDPGILQVAGDLIFRSLDLPFSDDIAERLKLMLPPQIQQAISSGEGLPPEAQAAMAQATQAMKMVEQVSQQVMAEKQALENEKAVIEGDKAEIQAQIDRLRAEKQVLDAHFRELQAKIQLEALQAQVQAADRGEEIDKAELSAQVQQALSDIQAQAAEFMTQAAAAIQQMQMSQPNVVVTPPRRKIAKSTRDEQGNLVTEIIEVDAA